MHETTPRPALRDRTTLKLGGTPQSWYTVHTLAELRFALAHSEPMPILLLGGGSNLVCSDEPYPGAVIELALSGVHVSDTPPAGFHPPCYLTPNVCMSDAKLPPYIQPSAHQVWLHVAAGERWDDVVAATCRWGLAGLECLSGIPGNAGATPIQNVGAYGQEIGDTLWSVTCLDRRSGSLVVFTADECELSYRNSRFKTRDPGKYVVVEVTFRLTQGSPNALRYGELARRFSANDDPPTLSQIRDAVLETRAAKSMVLDPNDPNGRSCGSFFLNPIVARATLANLQAQSPVPVPHFDVDPERVKVPAAWLIERAGFARGYRTGNVGLSTKHTLCLVAHDNASAVELLGLARNIRDSVHDEFGIELHPEPVLVGLAW